MSSKKPEPLNGNGAKDRTCPVCGENSYSLAGIHPQCSVRQADAKRLEIIKRDNKAKEAKKPASSAKPWQRACPKCKAVQHVRTKTCTCGHVFAVRARTNG